MTWCCGQLPQAPKNMEEQLILNETYAIETLWLHTKHTCKMNEIMWKKKRNMNHC